MSELPLRKRWPTLVLILACTLGSGALVGFLTRDSMAVYSDIVKPSFAPPSWVFPVAWTILYAAMSVSLWLMIRKDVPSRATIVLYVVQLAVNLAWPFVFFTLQAFGLAFWWLLLLLASPLPPPAGPVVGGSRGGTTKFPLLPVDSKDSE